MTLTNPEGQANPDAEIDFGALEVERKVTAVAEAFDRNQAAIHRWFWKVLIGFNLVMWSVAGCVVFVLRFH